MSDIHSTVTELPLSCKSAAEKAAQQLALEDTFADLNDSCCRKLSRLEQELSDETGEQVILVAYRQ
ncbi:MAG: hypothetical protein KH828_06735 [Clostridiales bacterium]|nr:hypothetical protein [Clostridiales bacterium]